MNFFVELWQLKRARAIELAGEFLETALQILFLLAVYGLCAIGKRFHYNAERLDLIESIDFGFFVVALVIAGIKIVGRMVSGEKPSPAPTARPDRPASRKKSK